MLPINEILEKITSRDKNSLVSGEYFLSLVIGEKQVQAGIWNFAQEEGQGLVYGSWESWGGENAEELIVAADTSIASAVAKLPEIVGKQPTKVILGLPDFWVEGSAIRKEKLETLQTVCKKLLFKPLGFVVTAEAVAHLLKKEEGGLPSLILVSIDESEIVVSLIVQGKYLGSKIVGRSNSLAMDLEEGLLRFSFEGALPCRIMLLGGKTLEGERESLISYPWVAPDNEKKLGFLQFPKIEIAADNFEMSAVILAGSHELGQGEVSKFPSKSKEEEVLREVSKDTETLLTSLPEISFGFIKDKDILTVNPPKETEIIETQVEEQENGQTQSLEPIREKAIFFTPPKVRNFRFPLSANKVLGALKNIFSFFFKKALFVIIAVAVVLLGLGFTFMKVARSEVKIFVQPQKIEKEFEFTISPKIASVDSEKAALPAREISAEVSDKKSAEVKGKKTVGEKAKGEIVIYNGTDKTKTLTKGTGIKGPGGLGFIISSEAVVPGKLTDFNATPPVDKWGEKKVSAEAAEIGAQYNLAANSSMSLESLPASGSSFLVKNPVAFSGGTSREIQAISKEDRENLAREIARELEGKAKDQIKSKISSGDYLLEDSILLKSKIDRFDGEVGDETSVLSIEGKYLFSSLFFRQDDLKVLVDKIISPLIQEGYQKQPIKQEKSFSVKDKGKGIYLAKVREDFLPEVDTGKVAEQLKAKKVSQAEAYLKGLPHVAGIEISVKPKIFSRLKFFPLKEENITVKIEAI